MATKASSGRRGGVGRSASIALVALAALACEAGEPAANPIMPLGAGGGGAGGGGVEPDCFVSPRTHHEIINACTGARRVKKSPSLLGLNADGSLPPPP